MLCNVCLVYGELNCWCREFAACLALIYASDRLFGLPRFILSLAIALITKDMFSFSTAMLTNSVVPTIIPIYHLHSLYIASKPVNIQLTYNTSWSSAFPSAVPLRKRASRWDSAFTPSHKGRESGIMMQGCLLRLFVLFVIIMYVEIFCTCN